MSYQSQNFNSVTGELVFKSEILYLKNVTVLLQLASVDEGQVDVIITAPSLLKWQPELRVRHAYRIDKLKKCFRTFGTGRYHEFYTPTEKSSYEELVHVRTDPDFSNFVSVSGQIVKEFDEFSIYTLDSGERLCLIYLVDFAKMVTPCVGDVITIENAHLCGNYVVACAKTCVTFQSLNPNRKARTRCEVLRNLVRNFQLGFKDVLWMNKQLPIMEEKFNRIKSVNPRLVLTFFIQHVYKPRVYKQCVRFLSYEFLSKEHNCPAYLAMLPMYKIVAVRELTVFEPVDISPASKLWCFWEFVVHYRQPKETFLIGLLELDTKYGHLRLSDSTGMIYVQILDDGRNLPKLHSFLNTCVLIREYVHVSEKFRLGSKNPVSSVVGVKIGSLAVLNQKASHTGFYQNVYDNDTPLQMLEPVKCYDLNPQVSQQAFTRQFCILFHKSSILYNPKTKGPEYHLYVGLLGAPEEMTCTQEQDINLKKLTLEQKCTIRCTEEFLQCYIFLIDWAVYEIRTPYRRNSKSNDIWWLPQKSKIISLEYYLGPCPEKLRIASVHDVSNGVKHRLRIVEGVIVERRHTKQSDLGYQPLGYGVFENHMIILTLLDIHTLDTLDLFMQELETILYPHCLVPGARIIVKYVIGLLNSSNQFKTTKLSSIQVVEIREVTDLKARFLRYYKENGNLSMSPKMQPGSVVWLSLQNAVLKSCELKALCITCNAQYNKGICSGNSCPGSKGYAVFAEARCKMKKDYGKVMVHVRNDLVRQLVDFSTREYRNLATVVADEGTLVYYKGPTPKCPDGSVQLFQMFCDQLDFDNNCIVVQCRVVKRSTIEDRVSEEDKNKEDEPVQLICMSLIRIPKNKLHINNE